MPGAVPGAGEQAVNEADGLEWDPFAGRKHGEGTEPSLAKRSGDLSLQVPSSQCAKKEWRALWGHLEAKEPRRRLKSDVRGARRRELGEPAENGREVMGH